MFQWASDQFDKLSETLAPPPTDGAGRFCYAVTKLDENTAMGCIAEIDPIQTVVNQNKGWFPIHMACQYSMIRLIRLLMNQPGASIQQPDYAGLTPLHHACMSTQKSMGLEVVKILLNEYKADPCAKNSRGETPYDVATLNSIRQYLLPIQLQRETQYALDNGGQGLMPGIDLGGLKISRPNMAPPPQFGGAGVVAAPPAAAPGQPQYPPTPGVAPTFGSPMATAGAAAHAVPPAQPIARAPASMPNSGRSKSEGAPDSGGYSRSGGSSLAVYSKYKADGFHSSSSDVGLQRKYGHAGANRSAGVPEPPSSGNAPLSGNSGPNPFSSAANLRSVSRYASYGPAAAPAPVSGPVYSGMGYAHPGAGMATQATPKFFTPGATTTATAAPTTPATSLSAGGPTSPFMPPPPYSGTTAAEPAPVPASPAVTAPAPAVNSPFVAPTSDASTPAATSSLFESPPKTTEPEVTNSAPSITAADESKEEDTSSDWVETTDPTSGKVYYFNSKTNETSWDNPNESKAAEQSTTTSTTPVEQDVDGENDWSEVVDPSSGQTYYYNSKTGETSWDKPSSTTTGEGDTANATADSETSQGAEWVEAIDPSSGNEYYYNSATGETSWERPAALGSEENSSVPPESSTATDNAESVADTGAVPDDALGGQKEEEEKAEDTSSPETNSAMEAIKEETVVVEEKVEEESTPIASTAETEVEPPTEDEPPTEIVSSQDSNNMGTETTTETATDEGSSNALPDGWIEATDPSSGNVYYCNINTSETSWERPVADNNTAAGGDAKAAAISNEMDEAEVTGDSKSEAAVVEDISDDWEEVQDPTSGKTYYYNKQTQETSWEKPVSTTSEPETTQDTAAPNEQENDWAETVDPSSGKSYYYNAKTGETSWEKPTGFTVQEDSPVTTANETQPMDADASESIPTSAEDTFAAPPSVDTDTKSGGTTDDQPQSSPLAMSHQRTQSAAEMFASPPGASQSNGTLGPSTNFDRPDFISPAAATQGSVVTPGGLNTPGAAATAEDLFGAKAADSTPAELPESRTAEDLFGASAVEPIPANTSQSTKENANDDTAEDLTENDDGDMTDIPLSPEPVSLTQSAKNLPNIPDTTEATPAPAPVPAVRDDLFAAIGMPPPPFQSRR